MRRLLVSCVALLVASSSHANTGRLTEAKGEVWVTAPGASETKASTGATLTPGTQVRTGKASTARVAFENGSELEVRPESSIKLSGSKRQTQKSSVVLFFGRVWNKVASAVGGGSGSSYEVATPNAVAGVRGTEFEAAVGEDGSVRVRVTEGKVGVEGDERSEEVDAGEEVEADEQGVDASGKASANPNWDGWRDNKRERLRKNGKEVVGGMKGRIMARKAKLEALRKRQQDIEGKRKDAERRARAGDEDAIGELRKLNAELAAIADEIADLGDETDSQFGLVDRIAELAADPRFAMVGGKMLAAEAESLLRVKADLDRMVKDGTDVSIEAMDKMLEDFSSGKRNTIKDKKGSAADDLFGGDDFMK